MRRAIVSVALLLAGLPLIGCTRPTGRAGEERQGETAERRDGEDPVGSTGGVIDPMGPNAGCYVCHMMFVREALSRVHLAAGIGCVACHGPSDKHANDENIGATRPDVVYAPNAVDTFCRECHRRHDVAPTAVVRRWREVRTKADSSADGPAAMRCTVCHGEHQIAHAQDDTEGNGT